MRSPRLVPVFGAILLAAAFCAAPQSSHAQNQASDTQSCQDFVQKFYDWYWNPVADRADQPGFRPVHTIGDVINLKPPVLDPVLLKLLKRGMRNSGGTGGLDFDPFLSGPAPHGKFTVSRADVAADQCRADIPAAHLIALLKKSGDSWVFADFHYSFYYRDGTKRSIPDADLIQLLTS